MKKLKYPFMIVGTPYELCFGIEGPNGAKVSNRVPWPQVNAATVDAVLDRLEMLMDNYVASRQRPAGSTADVKV